MKAFSWKIVWLLVALFASTACRLANGDVLNKVNEAVQDVPTLQAELTKPTEIADPTAVPTENLVEPAATQPTATEMPEASGLNEDSSVLPESAIPALDDLCSLLPKELLEPLFGQAIQGDPQSFEDDYLGKGCSYDFGEENGAAYFAYFSIAPISSFTDSKTNGSQVTEQAYLPGEAFSVNAADAQQLWVKLDENRAVVIAIGDRPKPELALQLAFLLVPLIQSLP